MAELWSGYIWPLIIIVAESVLMLTLLLTITAYTLYADRKIWAAVQIRRGPNVVGPWGLLQSFADLLKFVDSAKVTAANAITTTQQTASAGVSAGSTLAAAWLYINCRSPATPYVSGLKNITQAKAACAQPMPACQGGTGKNAPLKSHIGMRNTLMMA